MGFPAYFLGDDENGPVGAFWLSTLAMGSPAQALRLGMQYKSQQGLARRLRRGSGLAVLWFSRQLRCPKDSKGRAESPLVRPQAHTPCPGGDGRADYGAG